MALKDGHEGIMLRRNDATYKFGTATLKNGELMKVKAKYDAEAVIVDILPLKRKNDDAPVETNSLGLRKTVHKKEHFHTVELAGTLIGERPDGTKIKVGVGTALDRQRMWAGRDAYIGQVFTYEYAELTPSGLPRFPVFKGLRHD